MTAQATYVQSYEDRTTKALASPHWEIDGHWGVALFSDEGKTHWEVHCPWDEGKRTDARRCQGTMENPDPRPAEPDHDPSECPDVAGPLACPHLDAYEEADEDWQEWVTDPGGRCWILQWMDDAGGEDVWADPGPWVVPVTRRTPLAWMSVGYGDDGSLLLTHADLVRSARDPRIRALFIDDGRVMRWADRRRA